MERDPNEEVQRAAKKLPEKVLGLEVEIFQALIEDNKAISKLQAALEAERKSQTIPEVTSESQSFIAKLGRWLLSK